MANKSGTVPNLQHSVSWYKDPGLRRLYFLVAIAILSSATNGYDGGLMGGLQSLDWYQRYFNYPSGSTQGLLNSIQSVGSVVSLGIAPLLADHLGRKYSILVGCVIICLGAGLQAGALNVRMFTASRFFIGLGSGITGIASPLLVTELCHPNERGKVTALYNTMYYFGACLGGWMTYGTLRINSNWSWRLPSLLQGAPSVVQIFLVLLLPESPRWLIDHGKGEEAFKILAKYHANGNEEDEAVRFEYAEITAAIEQDKAKGRWKALVSTHGNRMRMFICVCCGAFSQFSGTSVYGYYVSNVLNAIGIHDPWYINRFNAFTVMTSMFEAWFWALMVDRVGRRPLFITSSCGMCCTFAIWIALTAKEIETNNPSFGKGVLALIYFHNFFYNLCWVSMNVAYPIEILPYNIRANGIMVQSLSTNISLFINQYVIPIGQKAGSWRFYFFFEGWLVIQAVTVYFFFIETKGATLEEISRIFDGKEAVENVRGKALELEVELADASHIENVKNEDVGVTEILEMPKSDLKHRRPSRDVASAYA